MALVYSRVNVGLIVPFTLRGMDSIFATTIEESSHALPNSQSRLFSGFLR